MRTVSEQEALIQQYETQEGAAGTGQLPTILVCAKGQISTDHAWLKVRPTVVLQAPVRLSTLVRAIRELLS